MPWIWLIGWLQVCQRWWPWLSRSYLARGPRWRPGPVPGPGPEPEPAVEDYNSTRAASASAYPRLSWARLPKLKVPIGLRVMINTVVGADGGGWVSFTTTLVLNTCKHICRVRLRNVFNCAIFLNWNILSSISKSKLNFSFFFFLWILYYKTQGTWNISI